ncbi:MAG: site-specific DNA-methyltransferase [Chloroflexota bacterium]|nr:site-specific DNA-methyltransferase [Chloroflexota bacterium]
MEGELVPALLCARGCATITRVKLDQIHCGDSRHMREVGDRSVQLIVTSPPYNVGKDYAQPLDFARDVHHDAMELQEYLAYLNATWKECARVLVRGGRIAVNVANTWRKPYIPLNGYIARQLIALGLQMRGEIIWDKGASAGISTAWGSFARASNPTLRDVHEYIMVFSKDSWKLEETRGNESGIENLEFVEWTKSVWRTPREEIADSQKSVWQFDTHSKRRNAHSPAHPTPFPLDLPLRLILLYTNIGDVVLDPFIGSGTTALAAKMTQRHYVGYEISSEYCTIAEQRLAALEHPPVMEERLAHKKKRRREEERER